MFRKSISYNWALILDVPTLRKRNLHRKTRGRGQWKKKTENLLSWYQIFNRRCKIFNKFWVVIFIWELYISWTFELSMEAGKCQDKETRNCCKQRFTVKKQTKCLIPTKILNVCLCYTDDIFLKFLLKIYNTIGAELWLYKKGQNASATPHPPLLPISRTAFYTLWPNYWSAKIK